MKKLTGHLEDKHGKWYAAVNHYDTNGKRHVKWYSLDIESKRGNKRKAEEKRQKKMICRRLSSCTGAFVL